MGRKDRARVLMDQKANSVADMAAVLLGQGDGEPGTEGEEGRRKGLEKEKGEGEGEDGSWGRLVSPGKGKEKEVRDVQGVRIAWTNILDAQFAQTWPSSVVHGDLRTERYAAADPGRIESGVDRQLAEAVAAL